MTQFIMCQECKAITQHPYKHGFDYLCELCYNKKIPKPLTGFDEASHETVKPNRAERRKQKALQRREPI